MNLKLSITSILLATALTGAQIPPSSAKHNKDTSAKQPSLNREEMMVLNLDRGPRSAHFYLLESLKTMRLTVKDLERAQHQIEQVDAAYAKVKKRPDDRTMQNTVERIKNAQQTADQLQQELLEAIDELKVEIKQTLVK